MTKIVRMDEEQNEDYVEANPFAYAATGNGHLLFLESGISSKVLDPLIRKIMEINLFDPDAEHITIFITSPGGDLFAAQKLISVMEMSDIHIRTVGLGQIASAGLLIFMCGHERIISRSTEVLTHQPTFNAQQFSAKMIDFDSYQTMFKQLFDRVLDIYAERTGKDEKFIKKTMLNNSDVFIDAKKAIEYGFADSMLHEHKDVFWDMLGRMRPEEEPTTVEELAEQTGVEEDDQDSTRSE